MDSLEILDDSQKTQMSPQPDGKTAPRRRRKMRGTSLCNQLGPTIQLDSLYMDKNTLGNYIP